MKNTIFVNETIKYYYDMQKKKIKKYKVLRFEIKYKV